MLEQEYMGQRLPMKFFMDNMVRIHNAPRAGRNPALNGRLRNSEDSASNMAWVYQERQILLARKMPRAWTNLLKVFGPHVAAMSFTGETPVKGLQGVTITADASSCCPLHPQKNARPSLQLLIQKVPKNQCWSVLEKCPSVLAGIHSLFSTPVG